MPHTQPSPCCAAARTPDATRTPAGDTPAAHASALTASRGSVAPIPAGASDAVAAPAPVGATPAASADVAGMALLSGGEFLMGTDDASGFAADGEGPVRPVRLNPFYIDIYAVTNARFEEFVRDTGYKTEAERFGWSFVFHMFVSAKGRQTASQAAADAPWWWVVKGAYWRRPEGPGSNLKRRWHHPATHISWNDAAAYCAWAGKRLPTESEWEYAARGGLVQKRYAWGDDLTPGGEHQCNIWQGDFPDTNSAEDGYKGAAPVDAYKPNGYGLYNMAGNVWEWTSDWFSAAFDAAPRDNPTGPARGSAKTIRGGSYLCHDSYCNRYRVAARTSNTPDSSTGNLGFRCARDA